nr:SpoIID/LytB domain-containing protein [Ardenticatenales bacterium]
LVVGRTPHGAETAPLGELWRYEIQSRTWLPLTANGVEEISPLVSPDGTQIAFLRDGDLWVISAERTTPEALHAPEASHAPRALSSHTPPTTIRVMHGAANNCRSVPVGQIDIIDFEEYVKRVVPHESPAAWHAEALKAQAVAARTYAWYQMQGRADQSYDVTDTTAHQYMCDTTDPRTNVAVDDTTGQHLSYNGGIIPTLFSAENSSPTRQNLYGHSYLSAVDDPISFGYTRRGHGQGYSQWGGKRWADAGWRYPQILLHYYTGARLEPPANSSTTLLDVANRPTQPYLRGSAMGMTLNGNSLAGTRAREWYPDGSGTLTFTPWQDDRNDLDGWSHLFDLRAQPDLPHGRYRVEYAPLVTARSAQTETLPVLYLGIDRTAPAFTATLTLEAARPISEPVAAHLTFQVGDGTSGMERLGWSGSSRQQEAEAINEALTIAEPSASGGQIIRLDPNLHPAMTLTFPSLAVEPAPYRVWFRVRGSVLASTERVVTLRLFDDSPIPLQRGVRYLRAADFATTGWEWFFVDIDMTTAYSTCPADPTNPAGTCRALQAAIEWHGSQPLEIDRLLLATRPDSLLSQVDVALLLPEPLTLYASDQAGNLALLLCKAHERPPVIQSIAHLSDFQLFLPITIGGQPLTITDQYEYRCESAPY